MHTRFTLFYYRCFLLLPILVPLGVISLQRASLLDKNGNIAHFFLLSIFGGAIPYSFVLIALLIASTRTSVQNFIRHINYSPVYLCIVALPLVLVFMSFARHSTSLLDDLLASVPIWLAACLFSLVLGYAYVGLAHLLYKLIVATGKVPNTNDA